MAVNSAIRWILVLPAAIAAWVAGDFATTIILNIFNFLGVDLVLPFLQRPPWAFHLVLFGSYLTAVLGGAFTAPRNQRHIAAFIVAALLIAYRLLMTGARLAGSDFTEDTPSVYFVGTLFAATGLAVGIWIVFSQRTVGDQTKLASTTDSG